MKWCVLVHRCILPSKRTRSNFWLISSLSWLVHLAMLQAVDIIGHHIYICIYARNFIVKNSFLCVITVLVSEIKSIPVNKNVNIARECKSLISAEEFDIIIIYNTYTLTVMHDVLTSILWCIPFHNKLLTFSIIYADATTEHHIFHTIQ